MGSNVKQTTLYIGPPCGSFELNEHQLRQPLSRHKQPRSYWADVYRLTGNTGRVTQPQTQHCSTTVMPIVSPHAIVSHGNVLTIITSDTVGVTTDCPSVSTASMTGHPAGQQQHSVCWPHRNRPANLIQVLWDVRQNTFADKSST